MKLAGPEMKVFGYDNANLERVDTPEGAVCFYCEEPIAAGDLGVIMRNGVGPEIALPDNPDYCAQHLECHMRGIFGTVGHQEGKCRCCGGTEVDPPGMSKREAAKAAVGCWMARNG